MSEPVTLTPEAIEAIARRVADLLHRVTGPSERPLLTAKEVEARTGLSYYAIRQRRAELGCRTKPGVPMLFSAERVEAFLRGEALGNAFPNALDNRPSSTKPRPGKRQSKPADLLEVKR
ncbi:MAG: hypothetical protein ACRDMH_03375 [Solirubrobacterales bacterium]